MVNTQYAFVKHIDKRHPHLHIVANRIDYDGKHIVTWPEILNSKDAEQKLIREYGLMAAGKKNLRATNLDALDNSETRVYIVYNAVKESLPGCQSLEDLGQRLLQRGIDTRYRVDEATGKRIGISFRYHQEAFKGSRIDREFSLPRLEERLAQQQTLDRWQQEKLGLLERQVQEQAAAEAQAAALAQALAEAQKEKEELLRKETLQQEAAEVHRHRIRIS